MKIKMLIVDDEESITRSLQKYFKLLDYDVFSSNSPTEALKLIEEYNIKLVITDIMMPEMSGIEMLKKIKKSNGMIQVIIMTGVVTIENVLGALSNGAHEIFLKPLDDLESIKKSVDNAIEKLEKWESIIETMVHRKH